MTEVPADTPVTTPVDELMDATDGVPDDQVPPFPFVDKVVVPLEQIEDVPLIVPAEGAAVTVTIVDVDKLAQPPVPEVVYVIVEVPLETPTTSPVISLIKATEGVREDQVPPVTVEVSVVVPFEQMAVVPESVPADVGAVTVTVNVAVAFAQPPVPATV